MGSFGSVVDAVNNPMWDLLVAPMLGAMSIKPLTLSMDSEWKQP